MAAENYKRKLTAILSADVSGYSRLMGDDEVATVSTLKSNRNLITEKVQSFNGRVVDSPGDNILSEFRSIVDAVSCAVAIQEGLWVENDKLPENRKMHFRIGVNLGDVIQDEDRISGLSIVNSELTVKNAGNIFFPLTAKIIPIRIAGQYSKLKTDLQFLQDHIPALKMGVHPII